MLGRVEVFRVTLPRNDEFRARPCPVVGGVELRGLDSPFGDAMLDLGVVLEVLESGLLGGVAIIVVSVTMMV